MDNLEFTLQEYVLTANDPKYGGDYSIINSKFPELADIDPFVLEEYVLTANDPKNNGDYSIINSKFSEDIFKEGVADKPLVDAELEKDIRNVWDEAQEYNKGYWNKFLGGYVPGHGVEEVLSKGLRNLLATSNYEIEEKELGDVIEITNPNGAKRKFYVGIGSREEELTKIGERSTEEDI